MRLIPLFLALFITTICNSAHAIAENPVDFYSDGCSKFPDGKWLHCCVAHDVKYYIGGTKEERSAAVLLCKN